MQEDLTHVRDALSECEARCSVLEDRVRAADAEKDAARAAAEEEDRLLASHGGWKECKDDEPLPPFSIDDPVRSCYWVTVSVVYVRLCGMCKRVCLCGVCDRELARVMGTSLVEGGARNCPSRVARAVCSRGVGWGGVGGLPWWPCMSVPVKRVPLWAGCSLFVVRWCWCQMVGHLLEQWTTDEVRRTMLWKWLKMVAKVRRGACPLCCLP